jgi:hypothetical protein
MRFPRGAKGERRPASKSVICGHSARILAHLREDAGSNRQSRGDIVLVGDHEIEILSIA